MHTLTLVDQFFVNFNEATVVYTAYVLATLLAYTIKSGDSPFLDIDPQEIVIMVMCETSSLSALFAF